MASDDGEMSGKLMTKKAFADLQGWSPSYITKLKDQGKLVLSGRLVDVDASLKLIFATSDPAKQHVRKHHADKRIERDVTQHVRHTAPDDLPAPPPPAADDVGDHGDDSDTKNYYRSKARREKALASIAEIELAKMQGTLVEAGAVTRALHESARMLRDMMFSVPPRCAPKAQGCKNVGEIERMMQDEMRGPMEQFVRMATDGLKQAGVS